MLSSCRCGFLSLLLSLVHSSPHPQFTRKVHTHTHTVTETDTRQVEVGTFVGKHNVKKEKYLLNTKLHTQKGSFLTWEVGNEALDRTKSTFAPRG
uniref:Putative secreted protein n=1 Tax=Ixodes ricinus TaxID=34613 RepID=A0A147BD24_IXORI